ncbi:MAG: immune inhibitor A [Candidatus Latescibacteria bacterium]|nr:immune inhibitor A [Candidatus Latescibacterota bacterium]
MVPRVPSVLLLLAFALNFWLETPARGLVCGVGKSAAIKASIPLVGRVRVLVLFGHFADEHSDSPPSFAARLFDPELPGSLTHFYAEMSHGQFQMRGAAVAKWYSSRNPASAYLARPGQVGLYGRVGDFSREIIEAADAELDLGQYDDDGPDGVPNSGDDDGYVDFVFLDALSVPYGFIIGPATGIALLGLSDDYVTGDRAGSGGYIRVRQDESPRGIGGVVAQGRSFAETAAAMAHEFGHALGLPDLFDKDFQRRDAKDPEPEKDSAGLGYWCLMAHGTRGWEDRGGPNPFCAWALEKLGWIGIGNQDLVVVEGELRDAVFEDVRRGGKVYKLPSRIRWDRPAAQDEYYLVEYRQPGNSYYERGLPGRGLLIWHVQPAGDNDREERKLVDLVCADGLYSDAGFPAGQVPAADLGGDNLDFWAHDPEYTRTHQGNLGDATDFFDGLRFAEFSAETNPAAPAGVSVNRIRRQGGGMLADLKADDRRWAGEIKGEVVWKDTVEMVGDVIVPEYTALKILPGTLVLVSPKPKSYIAVGRDREQVELIVQGGLRAGSLAGTPVRFTSAAAQPRPGDWRGILAELSGVVYLENVEVEYAREGVSGRALRSPQALVQVGVRHSSHYGMHFAEQNLELRLTRVDVEEAGLAGVRVEGGGSLVVEESRFAFNGTSGLEQRGGVLDCRLCDFEGNGQGVGSNLVLDQLVRGYVVGNRFSGGIGLYCNQVDGLLVEQNRMEGNRIGLISSDSAPHIARNEFVGNGIVMQVSGPRVPHGMELNAVQAASLLLENRTQTEVGAFNNWWGEDDEDWIAARMQGAVQWRPFLRSDPRTLPGRSELAQNYPNPFNGSTVIHFAVGVAAAVRARGRNMELVVRNSTGQQVRCLLRQPAAPGMYTVEWDGLDEEGHPVASGRYYYQVEIGGLHLARQMLLLK